MICPYCKGRGANAAEYGPAPCPDCEGTGSLRCKACGADEEPSSCFDCGAALCAGCGIQRKVDDVLVCRACAQRDEDAERDGLAAMAAR